MAFSAIFFVLKQSPVWVIPILFADIINISANPAKNPLGRIWLDGLILLLLIIQNIPSNTIHMRLLSQSTRQIEAALRCSLVRRGGEFTKLQT